MKKSKQLKGQHAQNKKFMQAVAKDWVKEFNKFKKKLNKKQVKQLDKYMKQEMIKLNSMIQQFGYAPALRYLKPLKISDPILKLFVTSYIKYTLLKMKKPKYATYKGPGPDPYTCGPEYFNPNYHNDHKWDNDRR